MPPALALSYNWRTPVLVSTVGLLVCLSVLLHSRIDGWQPVAGIFVLVWAGFVGSVWLRTRAHLTVEGSTLRVRHYTDFHEVTGSQLVSVSQFITAKGPSYKLSVRTESGGLRRLIVPAALLRGGHSTLFTWILTWSPEATLDKGCRKTIDELRIRGLIP
jgi:hypothetical protein